LSTYFLDPFLTQNGRNSQGSLSQAKSTSLSWLSEQTLNYTTAWNQHHLSALAGWTVQASHWEQTNISASILDTQYRHLPWDQMYERAQTRYPATKSVDEWALVSYLGRISYDFAGKYLFQANIRSDQSSKFAPGNRTATFPSFSAGWRISQESFMQNLSFINDLKIRAGWGQNGNQEGVSSYEYLSLSYLDNNGHPIPQTIAPQDLRWETTTQTNIGVDASFLNNRVIFSGDFYIKKTKDVLVRVPLSSQIVSSVLLNMGSMKNTGEEFVISTKNIINHDLTWSTDFNISFNKNKVITIGGNIPFMGGYGSIYERGGAIALVKGYGLGEFYGFIAAGVDPKTGDQLYLNSEGVAVPYSGIKPSDRRLIGSAQPDFVYGMTNNLSYKNFDLTVFIQGSQGNQIFNGLRVESEGMKDSRNQSTAVLNRWQQSGDVTNIPGVKPYSNDNTQISTRFLEDGSYLRFKAITLAYRFQPNIISRLGLSAASVYVSAQNLITITKYTGFDPEVNTYGVSSSSDDRNIALGVDYGAYPQAKIILFGINISLK
jgi:TonB-linked SusC/RagA family outer membrane protein